MPASSRRDFHVAIMKEAGYDLANVMELSHVFRIKNLSELDKDVNEAIRSALQTWAAHRHIPEFIELRKVEIRLRKEDFFAVIRLKEGGYSFSPHSPFQTEPELSRLEFHIAILKGEQGDYFASIAEVPGFGVMKITLGELDKQMREIIPSHLEVESHFFLPEFIKLKKVRFEP